MWSLPPVLLLVFLAACSGSTRLVNAPGTSALAPIAYAAKLTIPPTQESRAAFQQLEAPADTDPEAAWYRAHYLLDLFDASRFGSQATSRHLLAALVGRPRSAMQGAAATQATAQLIQQEIEHVLQLSRTHALAQQAQTLIRFETQAPEQRSEVFQRIQELKRVVHTKSALWASARLRLYGYCRSALQDAEQLAGSEQRIARSHCLYPLYSSNPEPYFAAKAQHRPPPPSRSELLADLGSYLTETTAGHRLQDAMNTQRQWLKQFTAKFSNAPQPLHPEQLHSAQGWLPYDDAPQLHIGDAQLDEQAYALRSQLSESGRFVVAFAQSSQSPALDAVKAATIAVAAGAQDLALLVSIEQALAVPAGDYQSSRMQQTRVTRIGQILLSLAPMRPEQPSQETGIAKATSWAPHRAGLALHLVIAQEHWQLTSQAGILGEFATSDLEEAQSELRKKLRRIQRAFPDEDGLVLVASGQASHAMLVAAATAAHHDSGGNRLFGMLAIATRAPTKQKATKLLRRITRRASAKVEVVPQGLSGRLPTARRCYLELVDAKHAPTGELRLELVEAELRVQGENQALATCARRAFEAQMREKKMAAVVVRFSVQSK